MLKNWMHDVALAIQAKSGATPSLLVWMALVLSATLAAFVFLCVAAYEWLSWQFGSVFAGLIMAGVFAVIALIALLIAGITRRRARERAILERAARARTPSWLLDPKILATAMQVGRTLGWQRIVPIALLGFLAAQWARERHGQEQDQDDA